MLTLPESFALILVGLLSLALSRLDKDNLMRGLHEGIRELRDSHSPFSQVEAAERSLQEILFAAVGWGFILIGFLSCFLR